jgi:hypothetical protein
MWPVQSFRGAWGEAFRNQCDALGPVERGVTIKETTMNTNSNTNTSGTSEVRELIDDELDAVNGGVSLGGHGNNIQIGQYQTGGSSERKAG